MSSDEACAEAAEAGDNADAPMVTQAAPMTEEDYALDDLWREEWSDDESERQAKAKKPLKSVSANTLVS